MSDDLISRSALLAELNDDKYTWEDYDNVDFAVQNLPAVDAVDADKALEWLEGYTFIDTKQVYTNGTVLVPLFRVRQALKDKAYNGLMEG